MPERKFKSGTTVLHRPPKPNVMVSGPMTVVQYQGDAAVVCKTPDGREHVIPESELIELAMNVEAVEVGISKTLKWKVQPSLTIYIDPGDASADTITELYLALSALYEAHGGSGLKIVRHRRRALQGEVVGQ